MRVMGIEALVRRPSARAEPAPRAEHVQPDLLRAASKIVEPNHVWRRRDLHPDGVRLPLSGGDHRLGQPSGSGVAALLRTRNDAKLLCSGAGGSAPSVRNAAHFQIPIRARHSPRGFSLEAAATGVAISMGRTRPFMETLPLNGGGVDQY